MRYTHKECLFFLQNSTLHKLRSFWKIHKMRILAPHKWLCPGAGVFVHLAQRDLFTKNVCSFLLLFVTKFDKGCPAQEKQTNICSLWILLNNERLFFSHFENCTFVFCATKFDKGCPTKVNKGMFVLCAFYTKRYTCIHKKFTINLQFVHSLQKFYNLFTNLRKIGKKSRGWFLLIKILASRILRNTLRSGFRMAQNGAPNWHHIKLKQALKPFCL